MATTWIKALHKSGGISAALGRSLDYIEDSGKTNDGELVDSYECHPQTAQSEFLFSKRLYAHRTGQDQGKHDVIAYHIRMSFKPGEVIAEQALDLGRELAMRWTKGKHQFIVAAHVNTKNPHVHVIYNSVNLDCTGKYQDFKRSAIALRRVSDQICLEHGLSVIENPGLSKGHNRAEYLGEAKAPTLRDALARTIDDALRDCKSLDDFIAAMQSAGAEVKLGKHLAFKVPGQKRFIRCKSLGEDYTEEAILERISGKRVITPKKEVAAPAPRRPSLLIDIQAKMQQGYGVGYEHWAKIFNLKEAAKTLIFLQENGVRDYDELAQKTDAATADLNMISGKIKAAEARMKEIQELQKHIGVYRKTRDIYVQYREAKNRRAFYAEHETAIDKHRAAKEHFNSLGLKKLPAMDALKREYASLATECKKLWGGVKPAREEMIRWKMAKQNANTILSGPRRIEKAYEHTR